LAIYFNLSTAVETINNDSLMCIFLETRYKQIQFIVLFIQRNKAKYLED